jgi:hypothetical protein
MITAVSSVRNRLNIIRPVRVALVLVLSTLLGATVPTSLAQNPRKTIAVLGGGTLAYDSSTIQETCALTRTVNSTFERTAYSDLTYTLGSLIVSNINFSNGILSEAALGNSPQAGMCPRDTTANATFSTPGLLITFTGDGEGNVTATASLAGSIAGGSSCAASASGQGQFICVVNSNNDLVAAWQSEVTTNGTQNSTQLMYLDLGITGTSGDVLSVGNSSCSSVADGSGDTVCAYNNNGTLFGVRFNVTNSTVSTPQNLGISSIAGTASCTIGNPRFTVTTAGTPIGATEGSTGDTICAVRGVRWRIIRCCIQSECSWQLDQCDLTWGHS